MNTTSRRLYLLYSSSIIALVVSLFCVCRTLFVHPTEQLRSDGTLKQMNEATIFIDCLKIGDSLRDANKRSMLFSCENVGYDSNSRVMSIRGFFLGDSRDARPESGDFGLASPNATIDKVIRNFGLPDFDRTPDLERPGVMVFRSKQLVVYYDFQTVDDKNKIVACYESPVPEGLYEELSITRVELWR